MKGRQRSGSDDRRLTTGCEALDDLLGGGFQRGTVSQVYGEPSAGKTNICLQTAVEAVEEGGGVVYIDTEGVSLERLRQIGGDGFEENAHDFIIKDAYDFEEQAVAVRDVENIAAETDLVVLDSATGLYRVEADDGEESSLKRLTRQIAHLTGLARKHGFAVIATNQIYTAVETQDEEYNPLGGKMMEHWTSVIVSLERSRVDETKRRATIEKHPAKPPGEEAEFRITGSGIENV
jgi:DNA repair protein RadB